MTNHGVLIPSEVAAKDVAAYMRSVISASAVDNGNILSLAQKTGVSGEGEVWLATAPSSASQTRVWMAGQPEQPFAVVGSNTYYGLGTILDFYNSACKVFTAFAPKKGDIIQVSGDCLDSTTTAAYAIPDDSGNYKLKWSAVTTSGFNLKYLATRRIPFASASSVGVGGINMYEFEVIAEG